MPLKKSGSPEAFKSNLKTELKAGKPKDQSLAIAYSVKRKAQGKKMAKGGEAGYDKSYANISSSHGEAGHPSSGGTLGSRNCPDCMAMGGACYAHGGQISEDSQKSNVNIQSKDAMHAEGGMVEDLKPLDIGSRVYHESESDEEEDIDDTHKAQYAEGGAIDAERPLHTKAIESSEDADNEKLHPEHGGGEAMVDPGISSKEDSDLQRDLPQVSEALSLAAEVMKDRERRKMAKGGSVESYEEGSESSHVGLLDDGIDPPTDSYETKDSDEMDSPKESNKMLESRGLNAARPHVMSDNEHDSSNPSEDDLVSQILKDRKRQRRGM